MVITRYSICCGKPVEKKITRKPYNGVLKDMTTGYYCSRCKRALTVYGNYTGDERVAYNKEQKEKMKKLDSGYSVDALGNLHICGKMYPKASLLDNPSIFSENYLVFDYYAKPIAQINVNWVGRHAYEANEEFELVLRKAKLSANRLSVFKYYVETHGNLSHADIMSQEVCKRILTSVGYKFNKNGMMY